MSSIYYICSPTSTARVIFMHLSSVLYDIIESETLIWGDFFLIVAFWVSEIELLLVLLTLHMVFSHLFTHQFRKVNILFTICEEGNFPFSLFLIPLRVVDDHFNLLWIHEHIKDGRKLFDLLLLVSDSIKKLFLLVLMLVLNVSKFC